MPGTAWAHAELLGNKGDMSLFFRQTIPDAMSLFC